MVENTEATETGRRFTFFADCERTHFGKVVSSFGGGTGFLLDALVVEDSRERGLCSSATATLVVVGVLGISSTALAGSSMVVTAGVSSICAMWITGENNQALFRAFQNGMSSNTLVRRLPTQFETAAAG